LLNFKVHAIGPERHVHRPVEAITHELQYPNISIPSTLSDRNGFVGWQPNQRRQVEHGAIARTFVLLHSESLPG
jgi:hypothetical protein